MSPRVLHPLRRALRHVPPAEARAALLSVFVGVAVLGVKFLAYFLTGSAAIFSDALESIVNVVAAGFATYSLAYAHRPADPEHPYGHGKIEFLSAGFEGGMILVAAGAIVVEAARALLNGGGPDPGHLATGLLLLGLVMVVHTGVGFYLIGTGRKNGSITLEADGRHLLADALTSAMALAALLVVKWTGWRFADPIGAVVVAFYIAGTGVGLVRRSAAGLLDEQDAKDAQLLRQILDSHVTPAGPENTVGGGEESGRTLPTGRAAKEPAVCSYHKLRHRHSGRYHWVDFHLVVPAHWNVARGHEVASTIEYEIEQALGEGNATAHIEPCLAGTCSACRTAGEEPHSPETNVLPSASV